VLLGWHKDGVTAAGALSFKLSLAETSTGICEQGSFFLHGNLAEWGTGIWMQWVLLLDNTI
jgi:hypothetical protein